MIIQLDYLRWNRSSWRGGGAGRGWNFAIMLNTGLQDFGIATCRSSTCLLPLQKVVPRSEAPHWADEPVPVFSQSSTHFPGRLGASPL